jgi:hypothetical protein
MLAVAAGMTPWLAPAGAVAAGITPWSAPAGAVAASVTPWSAPAALSVCPAQGPAWVVFPSDSPSHATGPGAIVWSAAPGCPAGEGARVAAIGADDVPGASVVPRTGAGRPIAPRGPVLASGAPHGQLVIGGSLPGAAADGLLIQGAAGGLFRALQPDESASAPMALATAYLGDVALASPSGRASTQTSDSALAPIPGSSPAGTGMGRPAPEIDVHVERFFAHGFVRNVAIATAGTGAVQALTLAMDYRSEALAVWAQGGSIYARLVPQSGVPGPLQRLAPAGLHPRIAAVLSDDRHAIVAWAEQSGEETAVYLDRSAVGVRFGAPTLLERFHDPGGLPSPAASPSLVRLSSESVVIAWAGSAAGHWVVRTAPVDLSGLGAVSTIAAPGADALLAALAAGPVGDALVLWSEPRPTAAGVPDMQSQALFAAHGLDVHPQRTTFGEPELLAPPAPVSDVRVAFDPDSDRAVAVWRGMAGAVEYSIRAAGQSP